MMPLLLLVAAATAAAEPGAQHEGHDGHHAGMEASAPASAACSPEHAAMGHCVPAPTLDGASRAITHANPPASPTDHAADRFYPPETMAKVRAAVYAEHGGGTFGQVMLDLAEYRVNDGPDTFHWDGEAWWGDDIDRLVVKSEGEVRRGEGTERAETQVLWSHALDPYWNLQTGLRQYICPKPSRTYLAVGVEGLAPYWFDVEAAIFVSDKGKVFGRVEASYDQRITQRLIVQPRIELEVAAQDVPGAGIGSGPSDLEVGLRLRYEFAREFAPYVGVSHERKIGDSRRFARASGEDPESTSLVFGVRAWF
jgi:copper resistance protein B